MKKFLLPICVGPSVFFSLRNLYSRLLDSLLHIPSYTLAVITIRVSSVQLFSSLQTNTLLGLSLQVGPIWSICLVGKALILCRAVTTLSGLIVCDLLHFLLLQFSQNLGKLVEDA